MYVYNTKIHSHFGNGIMQLLYLCLSVKYIIHVKDNINLLLVHVVDVVCRDHCSIFTERVGVPLYGHAGNIVSEL